MTILPERTLVRNQFKTLFRAALAAALLIPSLAFATNGYFQIGYGAKSVGMGGTGVANPQDALAGAVNPAGMAHVGKRFDLELRWFSPIREAELSSSGFGASTYNVDKKSSRNNFFIPNFGYAAPINEKLSWGISAYGNGGMNTEYHRNIYDNAFAQMLFNGSSTGTPDTGKLGVDLAQLIIAPTLAYKVNDRHTIGASLLIGVQAFEAYGLGNFQCFTKDVAATGYAGCGGGYPTFPSNGLTNNGHDWSYGAGIRLGWMGQVTDRLTLGAAATSKVYMTEFDDYDNLFAEDGDFDIPAHITVGLAFQATDKLKVALDIQRIFYSQVDSINNPGPVATDFSAPPPSRPLGTNSGFGFGWEDVWVYRLGFSYDVNNQWTVRAGYDHSESPIPDDELLFNILAPAVVADHVTLGFTYRPHKNGEWNASYMHAFERDQDGITGFGGAPVPAKLQMYQNAVNVGYAWKF